MEHHAPARTSRSVDEIVAAQRYIGAKLRAFELDQVTESFAQTRKDQGWSRAVRGALQRVALKAAGTFIRYPAARGSTQTRGPFERYVARVAGEIEAERQLVEDFELAHGMSFVRDVYHKIRDAPQDDVPTYKVTRSVFRKLKRDLDHERAARDTNPITGIWRRVAAALTYRDRELKWGATLAAAALATGIMWPVHRSNEWSDHHRLINHVKYERQSTHPIVASAIAARNLEMYLHELYNDASRIEGARGSFSDEYWDFIDCQKCDENDPASEPQMYNLRFTHNDAGNDWTRPWALLHRQGIAGARRQLQPSDTPVDAIRTGRNAVDGSWHYTQTDEGGHMEQHESCTTDQNGHETCTTWYTYECDWRSWLFALDRQLLVNGVARVNDGAGAFPFAQMPKTDTAKHLATPRDLLQELGTLSSKKLTAALDRQNAWAGSTLIKDYDALVWNAAVLANGGLLPMMVRTAPAYPITFPDEHASCGGPDHYPQGWNEHQQLVSASDAIIAPHDDAYRVLHQYAAFVPLIRKQIAIIGDPKTTGAQASDAIIALGDLGWKLNGESGFSSWHPTHTTRLFLEWLAFLGIGAAAGFGGYALLNKYRDTRFVRKLYENGIESELVDSYARDHSPARYR